MNSQILLIVQRDESRHVSIDAVYEFEAIIRESNQILIAERGNLLPRISGKVFWLSYQLDSRLSRTRRVIPRLPESLKSSHSMVILMGARFVKSLPYFEFSKIKSVYFFDAWPGAHQKINEYLNYFSVQNVFFSSREVSMLFEKTNSSREVRWIPEGINPEEYQFKDIGDRDIDVLSFGRRFEQYHEIIMDKINQSGRVYLFESEPGNLVFPTRQQFVDGLSRTKVSICVPLSVTHPRRAEGISTFTTRYLQSMASKCLVVGINTSEVDLLFDYSPIIEIDMDAPAEQLLDILAHYEDYQSLIERNYQTVIQKHTWRHRWGEILDTLHGNIS